MYYTLDIYSLYGILEITKNDFKNIDIIFLSILYKPVMMEETYPLLF